MRSDLTQVPGLECELQEGRAPQETPIGFRAPALPRSAPVGLPIARQLSDLRTCEGLCLPPEPLLASPWPPSLTPLWSS